MAWPELRTHLRPRTEAGHESLSGGERRQARTAGLSSAPTPERCTPRVSNRIRLSHGWWQPARTGPHRSGTHPTGTGAPRRDFAADVVGLRAWAQVPAAGHRGADPGR